MQKLLGERCSVIEFEFQGFLFDIFQLPGHWLLLDIIVPRHDEPCRQTLPAGKAVCRQAAGIDAGSSPVVRREAAAAGSDAEMGSGVAATAAAVRGMAAQAALASTQPAAVSSWASDARSAQGHSSRPVPRTWGTVRAVRPVSSDTYLYELRRHLLLARVAWGGWS